MDLGECVEISLCLLVRNDVSNNDDTSEFLGSVATETLLTGQRYRTSDVMLTVQQRHVDAATSRLNQHNDDYHFSKIRHEDCPSSNRPPTNSLTAIYRRAKRKAARKVRQAERKVQEEVRLLAKTEGVTEGFQPRRKASRKARETA